MARPPSPDLWIRRVDRLAQMPIVDGDIVPFHARIGIGQAIELAPGQRLAVRTGLMLEVPLDHILALHAPTELVDRGIVLAKTVVLPGERTELILTLIHCDQNGHPFKIRHNQVCARGVMLATSAVGPFNA